MMNFSLSLNKQADYTAIEQKIASLIAAFGETALSLNLVDLALRGQLTPQDIAIANYN